MDKTWIHKSRRTNEYYEGVKKFLDFAFANTSNDGKIYCPCTKCVHILEFNRKVVHDHLMCDGFSKGYIDWYCHGESMPKSGSSSESQIHRSELVHDDMSAMLRDVFQMHDQTRVGRCETHDEPSDDIHSTQSTQGPNEEVDKFYNLLKDAEQEVYPGCTSFSKLSLVIHLLKLKCLNGWSNKSLTMLLEFLRDLLPLGSKLPKDYYEAKKIIKDLGFVYEKIHVCPNDCMLFWNENSEKETCSICGASRWVVDNNSLSDDRGSGSSLSKKRKKKKKAAKILRWFPLKPRLQKLFMCSKTSSLMRWHVEGRIKDGKLRHPADSLAWQSFDSRYPDFASDPRNVRLGLSCDGFNPFGNMSSTYSTWPVILVPYNLPPDICMKSSSFILPLLIPGPKSPLNDLDVFLQPLIVELNELWNIGLETYDAFSKENFQMRVALMWTIHDLPAYGDVSGWNTKGSLACPHCNYDTHSTWLRHSGKYCYMGHRRFLPTNHDLRSDMVSFDGTEESRPAPIRLSGADILRQTESLNTVFGKSDKKTRKRKGKEPVQPWKKRSIFFTLPYWEGNLIHHNLDVMHIEKNVFDNLFGTLMNLEAKSKDNFKARLDLQDMDIRHELHPKIKDDHMVLPTASYSMSLNEKNLFCEVLKNVKVPNGYSSNISSKVQVDQRKVIGLKSHDCHILMQQLLPIALRGALASKKIVAVIIKLCSYFREICSSVLEVNELERLESQIVEILCHLEMIFPPSFFTVMVHLTIHLATEAKIAGPTQYRWMYPFERFLLKLKSYLRNRAYPEGSIAEGYITEECISFCSHYFGEAKQPSMNMENNCGAFRSVELDRMTWTHAHRYLLFHSEEITPLRQKHKDAIKRQHRPRRLTEDVVHKIHMENFCEWLRLYVEQINDSNGEISDEVRLLARGPNSVTKSYNKCTSNGYSFRTKDYEKNMKSQNSGVCVTTADGTTYYGVLKDIIELNYFDKYKTLLFKCDWVDLTPGRGYKKDEFGFDLVNLNRLMYRGDQVTQEPFILASQAAQVYYVEDEMCKGWHVVVKTKPKDLFQMGDLTLGGCEPHIQESLGSIVGNSSDHMNWTRSDVVGHTIVNDEELGNNATHRQNPDNNI